MKIQKSQLMAIFLAFLGLSIGTSCTKSSNTTPSSTVVTTVADPTILIVQEVEQFTQSYIDQALLNRSELLKAKSKNELISCVLKATKQISQNVISSNTRSSDESTEAWMSRSRTAALQSAQTSIEAVIASCST